MSARFSPTPFQRATIDAIVRLFTDKKRPQRRILVADEVGLGKTIVARCVIKATEQIRRDEGDDLFKVVYVCSCHNIVNQNLAKLVPDRREAFDEENLAESRLSMQHLLVAESDARRKLHGDYLQLIPITPETSFRVAGRGGTWRERAVICAVIGMMPEFSAHKKALASRFCGSGNRELWPNRLKDAFARVRKAHESSGGEYPANIWEKLRDSKLPNPDASEDILSFSDFIERLLAKPTPRKCTAFNAEIGILRRCFAEISAGLLRPDLVILDEFQRFRYLLDDPDGDGSEVKMLFDRFLRSSEADTDDPPRVLMLSATPFKLYSTGEESSEAGKDESFREFKGVLDFLFPDATKRDAVWAQWQRYTRFLAEAGFAVVAPAEAAISEEKARAEKGLRRAICRTERSLADVAGSSSGPLVTPRAPVLPLRDEIRSYVAFVEWTRALGIGDRLPITFAKSAPYLFSFLSGYKVQAILEDALKKSGKDLVRLLPPPARRLLWLNKTTVDAYRPIPWANARLKLLADHAFAEGEQAARFHPERLLWIPPTCPRYALGGPFVHSGGFSKVLVFSKWQFVPKMAASLLSYEAERRTIGQLPTGKKPRYSAKTRLSPRLVFRNGKGGSPAAMSLFTLLYPSRSLADAFSNDNAEPNRSSAATAARLASVFRRKLSIFPNPKFGRVDERWYYLAPMFLDDQGDAEAWLATVGYDVSYTTNMDGLGDSTGPWQQHGKKLSSELAAGPSALGRRPLDLPEVLADMALGSPAICLLRAGCSSAEATRGAEAFRGFFNTPEAIAAIDSAVDTGYPRREADAHWRNILLYGRDGCLQSALDEYLFLLGGANGSAVATLTQALDFRTTSYQVDTFKALSAWVGGNENDAGDEHWMSLRTHFAAAFSIGESEKKDEKGDQRRDRLRLAFNSPFRPFVLVSTSIGQEGLDFHQYCRKVFHWNLPHNPVDLEQREGRIDRWRGLAVRQNVAANYPDARSWEERFAAAEAAGDPSGLIPNWRSGPDAPWRIERIVPLYACSRDEDHYRDLVDILARFRMALGQPDQETLLERFRRFAPDPANLRHLFLDLCPFGNPDTPARVSARSAGAVERRGSVTGLFC